MKNLHPEDIKAAIRKKHGSLLAFEKYFDLAHESARDVLRGRAVAKTAEAMATVMGVPVGEILKLKRNKSSLTNSTSRKRDSHRINAGAN